MVVHRRLWNRAGRELEFELTDSGDRPFDLAKSVKTTEIDPCFHLHDSSTKWYVPAIGLACLRMRKPSKGIADGMSFFT